MRTTTAYTCLVGANVAAWLWAAAALGGQPALWGLAVLAYMFGLRHAFDADHIAAIDNVVRKLLQQGRSPVFAGLFFSLGHSTVVVLACAVIALMTAPVQHRLAGVHAVGGITGSVVSAAFLLLMGLANLAVLRNTWLALRCARHSRAPGGESLKPSSAAGPLARLCRPLLRLVCRSWHMYPVGLLFGLGFDTATEVGLLSITARSSMQGMPAASVLIFPALFTAGMSLLDTTDSMLMTRAYGWAFMDPLRKLRYNFMITAASVTVALCIGSIEVLGLLAGHLDARGGFWRIVGDLNGDLSRLGYAVVAILLGGWICSVLVYRTRATARDH